MSKREYRIAQRLQPIGEAGIEHCRKVLREGAYAKHNEVCIDLTTASCIVAVYDALNEANRAKLVTLPIHKAAIVCLRACK